MSKKGVDYCKFTYYQWLLKGIESKKRELSTKKVIRDSIANDFLL